MTLIATLEPDLAPAVEWAVAVLIVVGSAFSVLAAVGILRMPDLYMRMQAATKSATLGVSCLVLAAALRLQAVGTSTRAFLVIAFLFLTAPVAAHMIARAAYAAGVPLWRRSLIDELRAEELSAEKPRADAAPESTRRDTGCDAEGPSD